MRAILLAAVLLVMGISCKSDKTSSTSAATEEVEDDGPVRIVREDGSIQIKPNNNEIDLMIHHNTTVASKAEVQKFRTSAQSILDKRIKEQPSIPAIIDVGTFFFEFIVKGSSMSEVGQLDNKYIDFTSDNTYTYGINKKVDGSGKYHYSYDGVLLMIDDDTSRKPQEFQAKHGGDSMVLVGRNPYKDNNMQIKFMKVVM